VATIVLRGRFVLSLTGIKAIALAKKEGLLDGTSFPTD
jgi:hypothetical protein